MTTVIIDNHKYEVSEFIPQHPGEKESKNRTIRNYNGDDISQLFVHLHDSKPSRKEARQLLDTARKLGYYSGIKYLGPVN